MINEGDRTNNTRGSTPNFIARLKEYKEFIVILVFFVSGFMWIFSYFATKDQVRVLQCLTNHNIILIESRMQKKFLFDELTQKGMELEKLVPQVDISKSENNKSELSAEEKEKVIRLKEQMEIIRANLIETQIKHDEAFNYLKSNKCQNPQ